MSDAPFMLSVSGLRGVVGRSLTTDVAARYGGAFGRWLIHDLGGKCDQPLVVIGRDSRPSGQQMQQAVVAGLLEAGCRVIRLGVVTTPGVAVMIKHLQADGGMVITASHNPAQWNGIKALRYDGMAPPADQARQIIERFRLQHDVAGADMISASEQNSQTHGVHIDRVLAQVDTPAIRASGLKVVLDSVHGAGGPVTAKILQMLNVQLVHLYAEPDGRFPHEPEPTRQNLTGLCQAVREHGADIGFAQDPDGDRLAIVDETGEYIGEEYTLALCVLHVLARSAADQGAPRVVAVNLSTSRMIDDIVRCHGGQVVRTPVGEANVAAAMQKHDAMLGGEGNGGVILPDVCYVRDSLVGIALVLEMLVKQDAPLSQIVKQIPSYEIVKDKLDIRPGMAGDLANLMQKHFRGVKDVKLDLQDGVRMDWADRWVHVRPSNTEPIVRIIGEAANQEIAKNLINQVRLSLGLDQV